MKAGLLAVAAAIAVGVNASGHSGHRHAHQAFHMERNANASEPTCGCTTIYSTFYGEPTVVTQPKPVNTSVAPPPPATSSTTISLTTKPSPTSSPAAVVPTPFATTCPTTGVYTIPATTITLTSETTVCGASSTSVPAGTHTVGGVTTVVETSTTVVCPYATTTEAEGVVTSTILTTTYVCPSAGTYTIAPLTTTCSESTVWVYPTPASFSAGTYTQPEVVTTVTETDYVVVCPFTSPAPVLPKTSSVAPPASTSAAPVVVETPKASSTSASSTPTAKVSTGGSLANGQLGTTGPIWAVTYTPYDEEGNCKTADAVAVDIKIIKNKGFGVVRVYSTDCDALPNIGSACRDNKMKMIAGVFISKDKGGISGAQEQVTDLVAWSEWDLVDLIVVGNEAVTQGAASPSALAGFISSCKSSLSGAGYSGPVTTTEPLDKWQANSGLWCDVVDVVGCNLHPFFNAETTAANAGTLVKAQLELADNLCPGKYAINLETGWPSHADDGHGNSCNGLACAGVSEQAIAIKSIAEHAGGKSVMFSFGNDAWKDPGFLDCERSWGAIDLFTSDFVKTIAEALTGN